MEQVNILYQDTDIIIVNKPSGLLVHRYEKHANDHITMMTLLRDHIGKYVYAVNRIDRPVSGIVVFTAEPKIVKEIKTYWGQEDTVKEYITLAKGEVIEQGEFNFSLRNDNGEPKECLTRFVLLHAFEDTALYKVRIYSGRKHQIRRHFSRRCMNIIGDTNYGKGIVNREFRSKYNLHRIFLHSHRLKVRHPTSNEILDITCPVPSQLLEVLNKMGLQTEKLMSRLIEMEQAFH